VHDAGSGIQEDGFPLWHRRMGLCPLLSAAAPTSCRLLSPTSSRLPCEAACGMTLLTPRHLSDKEKVQRLALPDLLFSLELLMGY